MNVIFKLTLKLWSNYSISSLIGYIIGLTSRFCKRLYSDWPDTTRATVPAPFSVALVPIHFPKGVYIRLKELEVIQTNQLRGESQHCKL